MVAAVVHPQPMPHKYRLNRSSSSVETQFLHSGKSFSTLEKKLSHATPLDLAHFLKDFCVRVFQNQSIKDPIAYFDRVAEVIPLNTLQESVKDDFGDPLKAAQEMFEEAKLYVKMHNGKVPVTIKERLQSILQEVINVINSFVVAFGIEDFFKPANNQLEGEFKGSKIMMLVSLFTMLSTLLIPVLGAVTAGLIVGGIMLSIAALSLIWSKVKPMAHHLPGDAENLTKLVLKKGFVAQGRKESLDEMANILKMGRHALLVGPSRVGKSSASEAFAEAVARGVYPELKGKVVFRINTGKIVGHQASYLGGGNPVLKEISEAMGKYRKDIILVFDEIHMACKKNEPIADQLKLYLDEGGDFPHVIAITTDDEYERHVKDNKAFSLRFDKVAIQNTDRDETLKILSDAVLKNPSKPLLEAGILQEIYRQTVKRGDAPQPATSVRVLKRCITKAEKSQRTETEKRIIAVTNRIESLRAQGAASRGKDRAGKVEIAGLQEELKQLQKRAAADKKDFDSLFQVKALYDRVTLETYTTAIKISSIAAKKLSHQDEHQVKRFILLHQFLEKSLEAMMEPKSQQLGVKPVIDHEMVRSVIPEVFPG